MKTVKKAPDARKKTYTPPAVQDLGKWTAVTLNNSIPVIPIGPGGRKSFWDDFL